MEERICERDEFKVWSERSREWQMVRAKAMTVMMWYAQDEVNQEESEHNEVDVVKKGVDSTGKVMHMWMSGCWFVMRKIQMVELGWQQIGSGF